MTNSASEDERGRARKTAEELLAEAARKHAPTHRDPCIRAESEDDDGYDPYSDRQEKIHYNLTHSLGLFKLCII